MRAPPIARRRLVLAPLLLAACVGTLSGVSFLRAGPLSGDHPAHVSNAVELERMLDRGKVVGWSDFKFAGHLANGQYPPLAALLVAGAHRFGPGALDWGGAYGVVLLAVLGLGGALVFTFLRSWAGWAPALIATVLAFWLDPGDLWVGGRFFVLDLGVWPCALSAFLAMGALALLPGLLARPSPSRVSGVAVLIALSLLAHPFGLVLLAVLGTLRVLFLPANARCSAGWLAALGAVGLGILLAAWWLVPFALGAKGVENWPADGMYGRESLRLLLTGAVFRGGPPGLLPWAVVGGLIAFRSPRHSSVRWALVAAAGIWLVTCEPLWPRWARPVLEETQWVRLQIAGRWLFFGLAGVGAVSVLGSFRRSPLPRLVLPLALVACSLTMVALDGRSKPRLGPCWSEQDDRELRSVASSLSAGSGRIALYGPDVNRHCMLRAVPWANRPYLKLGFTPADVAKLKFWTLDPTLMARVGVTTILSDGALPSSLAGLPLVSRQGRFEVHELAPMPRAESLDPSAGVDVVSWNDERILLGVEAGQQQVPVRLFVTFSPEWRAFQNGRQIAVLEEQVGEGRFLTFRAASGLVEVQFHRSPVERVCVWISLVSLLALLSMEAAIAIRRARRSATRASSSLGLELD